MQLVSVSLVTFLVMIGRTIAAAESRLGVCYSVLLNLPYFNPVRLHNLFLGTCKRMFELWIDHHILTNDEIESWISLFNVYTCWNRQTAYSY